MTKSTKNPELPNVDEIRSRKPVCGLVMPISSIDNCSAEHWLEVRTILEEAIGNTIAPKFEIRLVSDADDIGVIQKRIVQNLYNSEMVVCDVSGKNPNVMFELGMRLAFDKPTVIVKDDKTEYSFDTGIIEHVGYPRDLRFNRIVAFKETLAKKIEATYKSHSSDSNSTTFLKNFGQFTVAKLDERAVPSEKLMLEMLSDLNNNFRKLSFQVDFMQARSLQGSFSRREKGETLIRSAIENRMRFEKKGYFKTDEIMTASMRDEIETEIGAELHFRNRREFLETYSKVANEVGVPF